MPLINAKNQAIPRREEYLILGSTFKMFIMMDNKQFGQTHERNGHG